MINPHPNLPWNLSSDRPLGKSKGGLTNGGLSPKFSEKIGGKSFLENRAFFGANWVLFRADRGLFGADRDQFLRTPQPRGKSRNCPERVLFGPIGAFRTKPPFAKPPFGFPREFLRKILVSVKFVSAILGPGNACANFMGAWRKCVLPEGKKPPCP